MATATDVRIGTFDILATYAYARALLDGTADDEAKERGMITTIMGAQDCADHPLQGMGSDPNGGS